MLKKSLFLLALAQVVGGDVFAQSTETEVVAVVNKLIEGLNRGDTALARSAFHPKARLLTVDSRGTRIEESADPFIQSLTRPRTEPIDERLSNVKTMIDGGLASVWADYKLFVGTRMNHCGIDHFLLVKEAAGWKVVELADTRRREGC